MKIPSTLALAAALIAVGAGGAMAGMSSDYVDMRQQQQQMGGRTIGDQLANGSMSVAQVTQLIQFTGLSVDDAKRYTVPEIIAMRWTNN